MSPWPNRLFSVLLTSVAATALWACDDEASSENEDGSVDSSSDGSVTDGGAIDGSSSDGSSSDGNVEDGSSSDGNVEDGSSSDGSATCDPARCRKTDACHEAYCDERGECAEREVTNCQVCDEEKNGSDCEERSCQKASCAGGACQYATLSGCKTCENNDECKEGLEACEEAICSKGTCSVSTRLGCQRCNTLNDCTVGACQEASCEGGACQISAQSGCQTCGNADDCTVGPCQQASCEGGACRISSKPECQTCSNAENCTVDVCQQAECEGGECKLSTKPNCQACDPANNGNECHKRDCATASCVEGECRISTSECNAPNLYFSEYVHDGRRALEIYNGDSQSVDLNQCKIVGHQYGSTDGVYASSSKTLQLESLRALPPGETWVVCNTQSGAPAFGNISNSGLNTAERRGTCNQKGLEFDFNGDDSIELICNGILVDSFGQKDVDPGEEWTGSGKVCTGSEDAWQCSDGTVGTRNVTLRRKCSVTYGDFNIDDAFDPSVEWEAYPMHTASGLGVRGCGQDPQLESCTQSCDPFYLCEEQTIVDYDGVCSGGRCVRGEEGEYPIDCNDYTYKDTLCSEDWTTRIYYSDSSQCVKGKPDCQFEVFTENCAEKDGICKLLGSGLNAYYGCEIPDPPPPEVVPVSGITLTNTAGYKGGSSNSIEIASGCDVGTQIKIAPKVIGSDLTYDYVTAAQTIYTVTDPQDVANGYCIAEITMPANEVGDYSIYVVNTTARESCTAHTKYVSHICGWEATDYYYHDGGVSVSPAEATFVKTVASPLIEGRICAEDLTLSEYAISDHIAANLIAVKLPFEAGTYQAVAGQVGTEGLICGSADYDCSLLFAKSDAHHCAVFKGYFKPNTLDVGNYAYLWQFTVDGDENIYNTQLVDATGAPILNLPVTLTAADVEKLNAASFGKLTVTQPGSVKLSLEKSHGGVWGQKNHVTVSEGCDVGTQIVITDENFEQQVVYTMTAADVQNGACNNIEVTFPARALAEYVMVSAVNGQQISGDADYYYFDGALVGPASLTDIADNLSQKTITGKICDPELTRDSAAVQAAISAGKLSATLVAVKPSDASTLKTVNGVFKEVSNGCALYEAKLPGGLETGDWLYTYRFAVDSGDAQTEFTAELEGQRHEGVADMGEPSSASSALLLNAAFGKATVLASGYTGLPWCRLVSVAHERATGDPVSYIYAEVYAEGKTNLVPVPDTLKAEYAYKKMGAEDQDAEEFNDFESWEWKPVDPDPADDNDGNGQVASHCKEGLTESELEIGNLSTLCEDTRRNNAYFKAELDVHGGGYYGFAFRFSVDGQNWQYCDADGSGNGFSIDQAGVMEVISPFVSEYYINGANKAIEIYNPTNHRINLADLKLVYGGQPNQPITFTSGNLPSKGTYVACGSTSNYPTGTSSVCHTVDNISAFTFSGKYSVSLVYKNGETLDSFGKTQTSGNGWALYEKFNLQRKCSNTSGEDKEGVEMDYDSEWKSYQLGSSTLNKKHDLGNFPDTKPMPACPAN